MANRPTLHFFTNFGRGNRHGIHLQNVLQEINLSPLIERAQRQSVPINLTQWLQQSTPNAMRNNEEPQQSNNNTNNDVIVNVTAVPETEQTGERPQSVQNNPNHIPGGSRVHSNQTINLNLILEQHPELASTVQFIIRYIPFIFIILFKELYEHITGIFIILILVVTFTHANSTVQKEVSRQGKRNLGTLAVVSFGVITCIAFIYSVFMEFLNYSLLLLLPQKTSLSLFDLLWTITITDYIIKLGTVLWKALFIALPPMVIALRSRGKYFLFIELTSHVYRALATLPPWFHYLIYNHSGEVEDHGVLTGRYIVGLILFAFYLTCKAYIVVKKLRKWHLAFAKLFQNTNYGAPPTSQQLESAGPTCPICQDEYHLPTSLDCRHIFCEECLALWFNRERTCPLCRANVAEDPKWKDGSTDSLIQWF